MPIATRDIVDLSSENKTEELAKKLLKKLKPGNIVFLYGEMGVGKTTFIDIDDPSASARSKNAKRLFPL